MKAKPSLKYQKIILFLHKNLWSFIHFCTTNKNYSTENAGFQPSLSISSEPPAPDSVMLSDRRSLIPMTQSHINNRALSSTLARLCNSCTLVFPWSLRMGYFSVISSNTQHWSWHCVYILITAAVIFNQAASTDSRIKMNHSTHTVFTETDDLMKTRKKQNRTKQNEWS